ncbi:hypothetical protein CEXT_384281 [Caerostris extrusa]|uniref:Uncharacterized protein n=1 Tax=Caerostris extrusa TaxID=172846 RepID=A0AAV4Y2H7_CAEEX|nr:hypothetical protein CEXT_384281 [Caerostris extrusa]
MMGNSSASFSGNGRKSLFLRLRGSRVPVEWILITPVSVVCFETARSFLFSNLWPIRLRWNRGSRVPIGLISITLASVVCYETVRSFLFRAYGIFILGGIGCHCNKCLLLLKKNDNFRYKF